MGKLPIRVSVLVILLRKNMGGGGDAYLVIVCICHFGLLPQKDMSFVPGRGGYGYV